MAIFLICRVIYMFARFVWRANEKPGAHMDVENRAAPEARSSRLVVLRRGADGSVQEQVLVVRDTSGAAAALKSDGADWNEVLSNLTNAQMLVCGMIMALGIASAVLGSYAEAYRSEIFNFEHGKCVYPFDSEGSYSAAAAAVLVAAQIIVTVLACYAPDNPRTIFPKLVIRTLLTSWITFFGAIYNFMIGDLVKSPDFYATYGSNGECYIVNPLVYTRGSIFAIITMFCHVTTYIAVCGSSSPAKANYTRIIQANDDLERPFPVSSTVVPLPSAATLEQREALWTKLQELKSKYLQDMKQLYGRLMQKSSMPTISPLLRHKVEHYINVVDRMISYLTATKERLPNTFNSDTVADLEKQIVEIMETFKQRRQTPPQQPVLPQEQQLQPDPTQVLPQLQQPEAQQQQLASATGASPIPATIPAIPPPPSK